MIETLDTGCFGEDVWLTADLHLGHKSILNYRPWSNIDKHDNAIIRNICSVVDENDLLIIVGDLTLAGPSRSDFVKSIIKRLPGKKILVYGNHDKLRPLKYIDYGFTIATTALVLSGGIFVAHDPAWAETWPVDKPMLCGYVHGLFRECRNVVNVGLDVWDFKPVLLERALELVRDPQGEKINWKEISKNRHKR